MHDERSHALDSSARAQQMAEAGGIPREDESGDPKRLRVAIAQTRSQMDATLDAIQERLRPERVKAQAMEQAKEVVRDATVGKAEEAVSGATDAAKGVGATMIETIKQNPIPAALVGIGLGWLLYKSQSSTTDQRGRDWERQDWPAQGRRGFQSTSPAWRGQTAGVGRYDLDYDDGRSSGEYRGTAGSTIDRAQGAAGQMMDRVQGTAGDMVDRVQGTAGDMVDRVQGTAGDMADQVQGVAGQVADQVQDTTGRLVSSAQQTTQQVAGATRGQFQQMLRDNPLALGGMALAAGLAVGLIVPETEQEDEWLGEARDSFMERAKETAQDMQGRLQQVAQEAGNAAQQEAKEQQLTT
jgi:ElaB/YqjD/DUF883 family membrane-anchored ribosome-binding protein/F0F1-type ATP synthase assembly protein I